MPEKYDTCRQCKITHLCTRYITGDMKEQCDDIIPIDDGASTALGIQNIEKQIIQILNPLPSHIRISILGNIINANNLRYMEKSMPRNVKDAVKFARMEQGIADEIIPVCPNCQSELDERGFCTNCGLDSQGDTE